MYKCGWQGCEKAYGTLNHLNAHVTMQTHGTKRTPEGEHTQSLSIVQDEEKVAILTFNVNRVQRDSQRMEAAQEGR